MKRLFLPLLALCASGATVAAQADPSLLRSLFSNGYLENPVLDAGALPPPPAAGSAAEARDLEAARQALPLRGTPRWDIAIADADIFSERGTRQLSCAVGVEIGPKTTPQTHAMLRRLLGDFAISTMAVKKSYERPRPFMVNGEAQCTPEAEASLRHDGSYPSGHSALGYGWGLVLASAVPDRAAQIVERGTAFGDSRRVCNVHWLSDVEEGRVAAAIVFARLQADEEYRADLAEASAELRTSDAEPQGCAAEAAALSAIKIHTGQGMQPMNNDEPRLGWLPREEWTEEARDVFAFWGEPNAREEGSKTNIIMTMAHHPQMTLAYSVWGKHLLLNNSLETRQLEILILRVAWNVKSIYEWHNHVGYGINAGLTRDEIAAIRDFPEGKDRWDEKERLVLEATDELMATNTLSDETWNALRRHYDKRQVMDLVMSVGHYVMTSWAINAFGVEVEGGADPIGFDLKTGSGREPGKTYKPGETENWTESRGY